MSIGISIYIYIHICIYPTPQEEQNAAQGQFFKWYLAGLNLVFAFS